VRSTCNSDLRAADRAPGIFSRGIFKEIGMTITKHSLNLSVVKDDENRARRERTMILEEIVDRLKANPRVGIEAYRDKLVEANRKISECEEKIHREKLRRETAFSLEVVQVRSYRRILNIIRWRLGGEKFKDIAGRLGISACRTSQIWHDALRTMHRARIREYLEATKNMSEEQQAEVRLYSEKAMRLLIDGLSDDDILRCLNFREYLRIAEESEIMAEKNKVPPNLNPQEWAALLNKSVDELEISVRASNCLRNTNIATIGELIECSAADLFRTKNTGKKSIQEIREELHRLGLHLRMEE
jgi:hypothetical protein